MNSIKSIARLNDAELEQCTPPNASWHTDYRDTAYIHIGGLPLDLSEGDVLLIFSQYGNPVHINLVRDKDTGKSRGFAFLKYEDQRSCDLAVDNLSGAQVLGRWLSVDHARYKMKEGERETVGEEEDETDREGDGRRKRRRSVGSESESQEERPLIKEEVELQKLLQEHDEDDPMKEYLVREKRAEVEEALKVVTITSTSKDDRKHRHKHRHRGSRRDDDRDESERKTNGHRSTRRERGEQDESEDDVSNQRRKHKRGDDQPRGHRRHEHSKRHRSHSEDSRRRRRSEDD
jgi:RNA-binding motif X-linked protein 2